MSNSDELPVVRTAKERTRRVVDAVKKAMLVIQTEVKENEGIYPHNHGRLTMAEVCRRARVHPITMMGSVHHDTTRPMIMDWIREQKIIEGAVKVRSAVTRRSDTAKEEYRRIAGQFQAMYQVEMPRRDKEIEQLREKITLLEAEGARLLEHISQGRVVRLPAARRDKK